MYKIMKRITVVVALSMAFAVSAHSAPKTFTFTGTVNQLIAGDMGLTVGDKITGQFIVDDQASGNNGNATFYPLVSVAVNVSTPGLGPWAWDGQAGSVSISNNLQGLDQFDFNASLSSDGTVANQIGGVFIQTQDNEGTIFNDESLPAASLPLNELEVARLELVFYHYAQFCTPDQLFNECSVMASLDEVKPLSTYKTFTFTSTVIDVAGDMGFAKGDKVTGHVTVAEQANSSLSTGGAVYPLHSVTVNGSSPGLGPWVWGGSGQVGQLIIANNVDVGESIDKFNFESYLSPDGTAANQTGYVSIGIQDNTGTMFNDQYLPVGSLPVSRLSTAQLELYHNEPGQFCTPPSDYPYPRCDVTARIDEVTFLPTNEDSDGDTIHDYVDNCQNTANPSQINMDGDEFGDLCDICPADGQNLCDPNGSSAEEVSVDGGGTVATPDGQLALEVGPGDLQENVTVSVTQTAVTNPQVDLRVGTSPGAGEAIAFYDLEPDGLSFASPVTLSIIMDVTGLTAAQREAIDLYRLEDTDLDGVPDTFVALGASCSNIEDPAGIFTATCTVEIEHFSTYAPIAPLDSDGDGVLDSFNGIVDACALEDATGFDVDNDGCIDYFNNLFGLVTRLVSEGVISSTMENSLLSKVGNAEKSADKANICAAVNQLNAFKSEVNAQTGKTISVEASTLVINFAESVSRYLLSLLKSGEVCN